MKKFSLVNLTTRQKENRRRILQISFEKNLSHIGSCLNSVDIIDSVYRIKKRKDSFVLSNGHAGIALYAVLERHKILDSKITKKLNIHPDRNEKNGIDVSTGSLGHGLPIALGMAIADKKHTVYCLISDGESTEGSIWESLRLAAELNITNLKIIVSVNGWGAYDAIKSKSLIKKFEGFGFKVNVLDGHDEKRLALVLQKESKKPVVYFANTYSDQFSFLKGQDAHYYVMNDADYKNSIEKLV